MNVTGMNALRRAVEFLGNQTVAAKVVGVSPQAVSEMLRKGRRVPAGWCLPLESATAGRITRHDLRPDLYPRETKSLPANSARDAAA
jgi:DNA-binding transcriptional regulator YdaS (Cro superfamily)